MNMKELIEAFPSNISEAIEIAENASFKGNYSDVRNIVICGMGGSGIGGSLVQAWFADELKVPVTVVKDYTLPNFVDQHSLVIGSSYSGNTEETLEAVESARARKAMFIGICSGGQLKTVCEENNYDHIVVPGGNPPRTALAFSVIQLIHIFEALGMISAERMNEVKLGKNRIVSEEAEIHALAKDLAKFLHGKVGILYGTTPFEPVLVRARQQFNENSKYLSWHHAIPEMNHNELVGWGGGDNRFAPVFFITKGNHPRNDKRIEITMEKVGNKTAYHQLVAHGVSRIEQSIYLINVVDWASFYLAEIDNTDTIDIAVIDYLKDTLSKF